MQNIIKINHKHIGQGYPVYIIAEMSANHNQDYDQAVEIVKAAKQAGADAIKLQTYTPDTMTLNSNRDFFRIKQGTIWEGKTLYQLYKEAYTPWEWQPELKKIADKIGIDLFSSPFDKTSVDFLEEMDVPAYKIASFELVDLPLIEYIATLGKPIIISTGMANLSEIDEAIRTIRTVNDLPIALLKCTSAYPASPDEMNLKTIQHLSDTFGVPSGLSDHSMGATIPIAAVAMGATIIEKHLTLSRLQEGPDSSFSMEPDEFAEMTTAIRMTERAMGKVCYDITPKQSASKIFRRSLFVVSDIRQGDTYTQNNVKCIRPANGLHPRYLKKIIGRKATQNIEAGTPLTWELIAS